jgi:protein SCO1/2
MTDALKILGPKADRIVPVFITVDPARDTVDQMKMYVEHFDPRFVGLTGTPEQVVAAAKTYRVYFAKQKDAAAGSEDYLVDHTSITYLMDRQGRFLTHFGHAVTAEAMAERIRKYL